MKKIFTKISVPSALALALALNSCNNADQVNQQIAAQTANIQSQVDTKLAGLQDQVNAECTVLVDSLAQVQFNTFLEEAKKAGHKVVSKVTHKTAAEEPKKEAPKPTTAGKGFGGQVGNANSGNSAPKGFGGQVQQEQQGTAKPKGFGGQVQPK